MKYDVCVFGGCSLDRIFYQKIDGTYNEQADTIAPGGKGANQAVAASKAGAKTTIITKIGKDDIGRDILSNLSFYNVNISNVEEIDGLDNDYSDIYINIKDKDNDIKRYSGAINSFTPDMIDNYRDVLLSSKIIVCQLKIPKEVTIKLINFCHEHKKTLILTPCRPEKLSVTDQDNLDLIDKIGIITCNKKECQTIFNSDNIEECVKKYPNKLIVTLGSEGLIYHNGKRFVRMPAIETDVVDTTGAGDTLNGNLSAYLAKGMDLKHALRKAMYASAMKLMMKTAQAGMPYLSDLETFIQNKRNKHFEYRDELNFITEQIKYAYESVKYSVYSVKSKKDHTLVTDMDLEIEKYLINKIKEKYPNDNFVTEETYSNNELQNRSWIIDPIDGTIHFIKKDGYFGIQLAFYDESEIKFSVIYLPEKNELFYCGKGLGTFVNNEKILPTDDSPIEQSIVEFSGSINKKYEVKKMCFDKLMNNEGLKVADVLFINCASLAYANLVMKRTDALIISTTDPWDVMPGEFMTKECDYKVIYLDADKSVRLVTKSQEIIDMLLPKE